MKKIFVLTSSLLIGITIHVIGSPPASVAPRPTTPTAKEKILPPVSPTPVSLVKEQESIKKSLPKSFGYFVAVDRNSLTKEQNQYFEKLLNSGQIPPVAFGSKCKVDGLPHFWCNSQRDRGVASQVFDTLNTGILEGKVVIFPLNQIGKNVKGDG